MANNFHSSAEDIRLDGHHLKARLFNVDGDAQDAEINLNDILGNENGHFFWGGNNFADSAEDITFSIEGDGVPILRAYLRTEDGEQRHADVNLAERLGNNNGGFYFD